MGMGASGMAAAAGGLFRKGEQGLFSGKTCICEQTDAHGNHHPGKHPEKCHIPGKGIGHQGGGKHQRIHNGSTQQKCHRRSQGHAFLDKFSHHRYNGAFTDRENDSQKSGNNHCLFFFSGQDAQQLVPGQKHLHKAAQQGPQQHKGKGFQNNGTENDGKGDKCF